MILFVKNRIGGVLMLQQYVTCTYLAKHWSMSPNWVRYLAKTKRIPAAKIGRRWLISLADAEELIKEGYKRQEKMGG